MAIFSDSKAAPHSLVGLSLMRASKKALVHSQQLSYPLSIA